MLSYAVTQDYLRIKDDVYRIENIQSAGLFRHSQLEQFARQVFIGLALALFGSLFLVALGPALLPAATTLFIAGVAYGLFTANIFELRAQIQKEDSESTHTAILLKAKNDAELEDAMAVLLDLNKRLKSR